MKKLLLSLITIAVLTAASFKSNAQKGVSTASIDQIQGIIEMPAFDTASHTANVTEANVNARALKHFATNFRHAGNTRWEVQEKAFIAIFYDKGVRNMVVYGKTGRWIRSYKSYEPGQLPEEVQSIIKRNFSNYTMSWANEIEQSDIHVYLVNVENDTRIKQVIVTDGQYVVYKTFKKTL